MERNKIKRTLQIVPGFISWSIILSFFILSIFKPLIAAIALILYLIYWMCKLIYMNILLIMSHHRINANKNVDWLKLCKEQKGELNFQDIIHVVLYPIYKEPVSLIEGVLRCLINANYPKDKIIVVLAGEERQENSYENLNKIKEKFNGQFNDIIVTIHPKNVPGEIPSKGANATYAAKKVKEYVDKKGYNPDKIIISCFDADTCSDSNYFSCLTYHFLNNPKRYRISYQPLPIYSNNIYEAPALARIIEVGSTFTQMIDSMRYEKFITFSSHSMSFKTLIEVDYWPVDLVSDDSLIFWKCFLKFDGDYTTYPLEVPVYMDIAVGKNLLDTIAVQYRQKRRWAYGIENFFFLGLGFMDKKNIPSILKFRKLFQILDQHINWATWAIIVSFISPLILSWGAVVKKNSLVLFNVSYMNNLVYRLLAFMLIICIFMSMEFLPPRPKNVSRFIYVSFFFQWLFIPLVSAILGSLPSLDAQTRMMLGKYLGFTPTPKRAHSWRYY